MERNHFSSKAMMTARSVLRVMVAVVLSLIPTAALATTLATTLVPTVYRYDNVVVSKGAYTYPIDHPFVAVTQIQFYNEDTEELEEHVKAAYTATSLDPTVFPLSRLTLLAS